MIGLNEHRAASTQEIIAVFSDDQSPLEGLSLFFPVTTSNAKELKIEVQRNAQPISVDVSRRDATRNTFSTSTEKVFIPPYHNEYFDFTSLDNFDKTFYNIMQGGTPNPTDFTALISSGGVKAIALKNKIARAKEKQRASVLLTGVVSLVNGDSIDFKRKASHMVQLTSTATWDNLTTSVPLSDLAAQAQLIKDDGLSTGNIFRVILGQNAFGNLMASSQVKNQAQFFNQILRTMIGMPTLDKVSGMTFQGRIGYGDFIFDLFTYSGTYQSGSSTLKYISVNAAVVIADDFVAQTAHGAVPAIMGTPELGQIIAPMKGEYYLRDVIDPHELTWNFYVSSAPLAIPISVDRIGTIMTM